MKKRFPLFLSMLICMLLTFLVLCLVGCRSAASSLSQVSLSDSHHQTSSAIVHDTTIVRDSLFFEAAGCTIRVREVRDRYHIISDLRTDTLSDTLYRTITKTEVRERVVHKFGWLSFLGTIGATILVIFMFYNIFRRFSSK